MIQQIVKQLRKNINISLYGVNFYFINHFYEK